MKYRWSFASPQPESVSNLSSICRISPLLARCLVNRGVSDPASAAQFLDPRLKQLSDPFLIPNMQVAVDRLLCAREKGEPLVIFGDYDVDGVTSTALLVETLTFLGWKVHYYLPLRLGEGYGLSQDGVENCLAQFPVTLMLAVDCGSTATVVIDSVQARGIDVIVLDHHQVSIPAPRPRALVNPQLSPGSGNGESFTELCSVGLSFKLAHALLKRMREQNVRCAFNLDLRNFLDLVALGTIADLVPLRAENRILVSTGLERLSQTQRPGLLALKQVAQCAVSIGCYEVGFQIAPRLNAAGRLENARQALDLLMAPDMESAEPLAQALDQQNRERQAIERSIAEEVIAAVRSRFNPDQDFVIIEGHESWHLGVVGIVASRVLNEFYRPTIIFGGDSDHLRGSGRSIDGFDLADALRKCSDLLLRHGGHAMAAGVSIHPSKLEEFRMRLGLLARNSLQPDLLRPALGLDAEACLSDLEICALEELSLLNPIGQGNPPVRLVVRGLTQYQTPLRMGKEEQHVKLRVTDGHRTLEAVWWNAADSPLPTGRFDLACIPQINDYNGRRSVQLKVLDWRPPS